MTPLGDGDLNFQQFFQTIGERNFHHANWEMDTAPAAPRTGASRSTSRRAATATCPT
ncbi:hypothetical protein NKG94_41380 [Micromonospora sp. M12]